MKLIGMLNGFLGIVIAVLGLSSCGINSNIMFKVPKSDQVYGDSIPMTPTDDYRISVDDKLTFQLYTNDGEVILQNNAGVQNPGQVNMQQIEYLVKRDGSVELPKIGATFPGID